MVRKALIAIGFMLIAIVISVLAKESGLRGPALETARSASMLLAGLCWYAILWPGQGGALGGRLLVVFWIAALLLWIAALANGGERRQFTMESIAIGFAIFCADLTVRQVVRMPLDAPQEIEDPVVPASPPTPPTTAP
jgi:hypothetical protein